MRSLINILTVISRLFVGILFILSGLIKANDPLGFGYKLQEYFEVFHIPWLKDYGTAFAIFICALEIGLGVALLIGYRQKLMAWPLLLLIVFFTFLTFYSAYFNKVTDCGCFGDALHLTPWQSFGKDLILLIPIILIFIRRNNILPLFGPAPGLSITLLGFGVSTIFSLYCYRHLPVIDFRPFKIGTNIPDAMKMPPGAVTDSFTTVLKYKNLKTGELKEFNQQNFPWQDTVNWKWDTTINKKIREGYKTPIHDFSLTDLNGGDADEKHVKYTKKFLSNPDYSFFLICYDLQKTENNQELMKKINSFYDECTKAQIDMIALSASVPATVDKFKHEQQALYDFYTVDETTLKTMIRSNPGLMLLKNGTVIAVWHHHDFPTLEEVKQKYFK